MKNLNDGTYAIREAHYAKGQHLVQCPSNNGFKTRAARLIGDGLKGRWSSRERGYITSPTKVAKFERLFADGWDACPITGKLQPPEDEGSIDA